MNIEAEEEREVDDGSREDHEAAVAIAIPQRLKPQMMPLRLWL